MKRLSPTQLRARAAELRDSAAQAAALAEAYERMADEAEARLTSANSRAHNDEAMLSAHRVQLSRAVSAGNKLAEACNEHGLTVRMLADELGCSGVLLVQARKGLRSISRRLAEQIEARVGYAATRANWPRLRSD